MAGVDESPVLKNTKACIRSVLMSCKEGVAASRFFYDYRDVTGESIPYQKLGFANVGNFIKSIPDVVCARTFGGEVTYFAVADAATQHIQSLIQRQKSNPKKSKSLRKGAARIPKFHSQVGRFMSSRGGHRPGPPFRPPPNNVSGFAQPRHFGLRSPLANSFNSSDFSPLTVTVRSRLGGVEDERTIDRREGANGGRFMASSALKAAVREKKSELLQPVGPSRNYELPPRFQKMQSGGVVTNTGGASDRPIAGRVTLLPIPLEDIQVILTNSRSAPDSRTAHCDVVQPSPQTVKEGPVVSEDALPRNAKTWAEKLLKIYPQGLWSTRFTVLYNEEFRQEPPSNLMDIVQTWTDIIRIEMNRIANRQVLYPAAEGSQTAAVSPVSSRVTEQRTSNTMSSAEVTSRSQTASLQHKWENFIVPIAQLFEVGEMTEVYASHSFDLSHLYLQRADSCAEDITEKLNQIHQELVAPKSSDLQPGVFCAALYSEDDNWYRARVLFLHSDKEVQVMFIDYGNVENVSISNIRCLTQETAETAAQAVGCVMFALKPLDSDKGWSDEAKTQFAVLMADKKLQAFTIKIQEGNCVVELWSEDVSKESLNEQLYNAGLVDTYLPKNFDPAELELPQEGYLEVVVAFVDLTHCWLRVIGQEYSERLEAFEDHLASLYEEASKQPKRFQEDSVCIAHDELLYHRVKIKQIRENEANCFYVDHGYTEWFKLDQLAPLDNETNMSLSYQAVLCVLSGLEEHMSNPTTITELVERSRNKICYAEIIMREPLKVMLFDTHGKDDVNINEEIAQKLASEGHTLDLTPFTPITDNTSESSRGSSPRPPSNPPSQPDVDALQSATRGLNLDKDSPPTSAKTAVNSNISQDSTQQEGGARPKTEQNVKVKTDASKPVGASQPSDLDMAASLGVVSPGAGAASQFNDSLCVAYHTWPLPSYVSQPEVGQFFDVYVQSVSDPSNFVIVPHNVLAKLEKTMEQMNAQFNAELSMELYGNASEVKEPTKVPAPQSNHLYMASVEGTFYRAVYLDAKETLVNYYHIFLPDYCEHALIRPEELFFLPRKFWSMPFAAFKACLYGVKPVGSSKNDSAWTEPSKYTFIKLTSQKTLIALLKEVIGGSEVGDGGDATQQVSKQKLSLHLINTSDPVEDIIVADALLASGFGAVVSG
ncbi:tudor domain-containing protein 7B-like isoform X2 [Littorina saxatilis]|uniref:tudor domain-containing protein 7B-like isoform X2 n=1 Tax=Littorina saxatilis TaxID=31220 RepID=UPI0038B5891D